MSPLVPWVSRVNSQGVKPQVNPEAASRVIVVGVSGTLRWLKRFDKTAPSVKANKNTVRITENE